MNPATLTPFTYQIHSQQRYVEISFIGVLTKEVVFLYLHTVWENNPDIAGFSELIDLRHVESIDMDTGELANIVAVGRSIDDSTQQSKMALFVTDAENFPKTELYLSLQQMFPANNKATTIFDNHTTAKQWLLGK